MRVLIYCNGAGLPADLFHSLKRSSDVLVAADGGMYHYLAHGVVPDLIIGDLDSFTDSPPEGVQVIHDADQETNDLQKALSWARERGVTAVTVVGAAGDRLDHNLNNLSVLLEYADRFVSIVLVDAFGRHFVVTSPVTIATRPGLTVSLFPLSGRVTGVVTGGLRYPLIDEDLQVGVRTGCLNEATGDTVRVDLRGGALLVSVEH